MGVEIALPFSIRFSQKEMQIITGSLLFGKTIAIHKLGRRPACQTAGRFSQISAEKYMFKILLPSSE